MAENSCQIFSEHFRLTTFDVKKSDYSGNSLIGHPKSGHFLAGESAPIKERNFPEPPIFTLKLIKRAENIRTNCKKMLKKNFKAN